MKKVFALFAIAGMLFASSCGNKEVSEEATEVEVIEETPEVIEETPEVDTLEVVEGEDSTVVVE